MFNRKVLTGGAIAATLALVAACGGDNDDDGDFPSGDVRMVVSYAAGGPTDVAGRAIANFMEEDLGITVVVENREGASGSVGTGEVMRSEADGYTIAMTTASAASRVPLIDPVGYDLEDVQSIGVATYGPGLVLVRADSDYETIDDLVAAAEANPGALNFATAGAASPQHVELERWEREYGVDIEAVPFQGEAPAVTALLGQNVDGCFCSNAQTTLTQVDAGEFRVLATGSPERLSDMPDVPTLAESGYESLIYGNSYFILVAPQGIPDETLEVLEGTLERALQDEEIIQIIGDARIPDEFIGSDALQSLMEDEQATLGPIFDELFG